MCNYCQTGLIFGNTGCGYTRWYVQRICYDCQGNMHVTLSNGCQSRRVVYGTWQGVGETTTTGTTNNGCAGRCITETVGQGNTTQNVNTAQGCNAYYAQQYGLYPYNGYRSCGCNNGFGNGTAL